MANNAFLAAWAPRVLSILRIMAGLLILQHGMQKWFGFPPSGKPFEAAAMMSMGWWAMVLEFFGGILLTVGLFTRPTAFILSGLMAAAYFIAHAKGSYYPIVNRGELAVLYCFVYLYLAVAGGGAWSLDNLIRGSRSSAPGPT